MARFIGPLGGAIVLFLIGAPLVAILMRAGGVGSFGGADWASLRFTLWQAVASALISIAMAIPVARALARRAFPGRKTLITLLGAPFVLPVISAIFGIIAVFGRNGIVNTALEGLGLPTISIYGAHGVILAHVFFNLPLAIRLILQGWVSIPAERFRLAEQLDQPVWRILELPMLRQTVPGVFLVIFLVCSTSFAVALILGGGPSATTIELAIYQAVRFDFDLGKAALLAMTQLLICALALAVMQIVRVPDAHGAGLDRVVMRWDGSKFIDTKAIALATVFLIVPLGAIALSGLSGMFILPASVLKSAGVSIIIALTSTALCLIVALPIVFSPFRWVRSVSILPLSVTSLVLGTGLYLIISPYIRPDKLALPITAVLNALFALPFVVRTLAAAYDNSEEEFGRLADEVGLSGWARFRILTLPRITRPLGFAAGLTAALSMGDLGVITLFAGAGLETLPLTIFRLMGAYRMEAASGASLLLVILSFGMFWIFDRGGRGFAAT